MDDLVCRTNRHWNAGLSQYYLFNGGKNPKSHPAMSFEADQFKAYFYLNESGLFVGTRKGDKGLKSTAIPVENPDPSKQSWETGGLPVHLSGSSFGVVSQTGPPMVRVFSTSGDEIAERSKILLKYPPRPDLKIEFIKTVPDGKEWLVIPSVHKGRESVCLVRIR